MLAATSATDRLVICRSFCRSCETPTSGRFSSDRGSSSRLTMANFAVVQPHVPPAAAPSATSRRATARAVLAVAAAEYLPAVDALGPGEGGPNANNAYICERI